MIVIPFIVWEFGSDIQNTVQKNSAVSLQQLVDRGEISQSYMVILQICALSQTY